MSHPHDIEERLRELRDAPVAVPARGLLDVEQRGRSIRRRNRLARLSTVLTASAIAAGIMLSRQTQPTTDPVHVGPAATTTAPRTQPLPTATPSTDPPPTDQLAPNNQPDPQEVVATEAAIAKLNAQIEAGWIPFRSSPALPGIDDPPELWLSVNSDYLMQTLRTLGEASNLVGAAPLYDRPQGSLVGYHIPGFGYIPVDKVPEVDTANERIAIFGCDPLAEDNEARQACRSYGALNGIGP